jgi:hypothetical protein
MSKNPITHVTQAAAKVTGKRFCFDHQGEVAVDAGCLVTRNKSRRWICFRCQEKSKSTKMRSGSTALG